MRWLTHSLSDVTAGHTDVKSFLLSEAVVPDCRLNSFLESLWVVAFSACLVPTVLCVSLLPFGSLTYYRVTCAENNGTSDEPRIGYKHGMIVLCMF